VAGCYEHSDEPSGSGAKELAHSTGAHLTTVLLRGINRS
jgi:hypothetical protein